MRNVPWVFALVLVLMSAGMAFAMDTEVSKEADAAIDAYLKGQLTYEQKVILNAENINPDEFVGTDNFGGPDGFGYSWMDSEEAGLDYSWIDISGTGTLVEGLGDDNIVGPFPIGFTFPFYGTDNVDFYINSNGSLNFDGVYEGLSNYEMPTPNANGLIAWFWDDLDPADDADLVYYETITHEGQDALVVSFIEYDEYPGGNDIEITAQVVLMADGSILMQYATITETFDIDGGTIGIQGDGTTGTTVLHNGSIVDYPYDGLAILFYQEAATSTLEGTVTDFETGAALEGVTVGVGTQTTMTDANGFYMFDEVFPGDVTITGDLDGYWGYSEIVTLVDGQNIHDFTLEPAPFVGWFEVPYTWVDVTDAAVQVAMGDDSSDEIVFADIGLGTFAYFGVDYSSINVCSNGFLSFTSGSTTWSVLAMPDVGEPNATLALCSDDLHGTNGDATIMVDLIDGQLVVSYLGVQTLDGGMTITAQTVLDFNTGVIYYNYQSFVATTPPYTGVHSIGYENETGEIGEQIYYGDEWGVTPADMTSYMIGEPLGTLDGMVYDNADMSAISGAEVTVYEADGMDPITSMFTGDDGMYSFDLAGGLYDISVVAPAYAAAMVEDILVESDVVTTVDVGLDATEEFTTVTGVISSMDTPGEVVEGITVSLYTPAGDLVGSSVTDAMGVYSIGNDDIAVGFYDIYIAFDPVGTNFYHDASFDDVDIMMNTTYDFGVYEILAPADVAGMGGNTTATIMWDLPANAVEVTGDMIERLQARVAVSEGEKLAYYSQQLEYLEALHQAQLNGTDDLGDLAGFIVINDALEVVGTTDAATMNITIGDLLNGAEYQFAVAADYGYGDDYLVFSEFITVEPAEVVYLFNNVDFDWYDVQNDANVVAPGLSDDGEVWVDFGDTFTFYGVGYTGITIGSNGAMSFEAGAQIPYSNPMIPDAAAPNAVIAPFWTDFNPSGDVMYDAFYTFDADGNFWVEWYSPYYGATEVANFECKLDFDEGTILFQYNTADLWDETATVGVEDETGENGSVWLTTNVTDEVAVELEFAILEYGDIEGYVVDVDDNGIEGCEVFYMGTLLATTAADGFYEASTVAGDVDLLYVHPDYAPLEVPTTILPEQLNTLDDVVLTGWGTIEGYVVDVDDNGIGDATVSLAGVLLTTTDAMGWYSVELMIPSGDYEFDFAHAMYWPESATANVTLGATTVLDDVVMTAPGEFDITPTSLELTVYITPDDPVYTGSETLDLTNGGSGRIEFDAGIEILSVPDHWGMGIGSNPDPNDNTIERAFSRGESGEASPFGPVAATWNSTDDLWDLLEGWDTEDTQGGVGAVVTDDRVYTCEWGYQGLYGFFEYDHDGNLIRTETFPTALQGVRDMAWDGEWLYGGNANANGTIYKFNPDDLDDYELLGTAPGLGRGVALDFSTGDIYTTNWSGLGKLVHVGAGVYTFEAMDYPADAASCYGCAWMPADPDDMNLWLYCQPAANAVVFRVDPTNTGNVDTGYEVYSSDLGMAGGIDIHNSYDATMWNIATNVQATPDHIDIWEGYLAGIPWLFVEPEEGVIDPGNTETITISFNVEGHDLLNVVEHMDEVEAGVVFEGPHWEGGEVPMLVTFINSAGEINSEIPMEYALHQNYPNPFNPATTIKFDLVNAQNVKIAVFNVLGQQVAQIVNGRMEAGFHTVAFDASQLSSGVYFYRMETGAYTNMKKMVLVK